jgi:murein L,D-transpeptidase YafK
MTDVASENSSIMPCPIPEHVGSQKPEWLRSQGRGFARTLAVAATLVALAGCQSAPPLSESVSAEVPAEPVPALAVVNRLPRPVDKPLPEPLDLYSDALERLLARPGGVRSGEVFARVGPGLVRALHERGFRFGAPVFIRIFKESREMELWLDQGGRWELFRTYPVCAFSGNPGPKQREGDMQSPEGFYQVTPEQLNPRSSYHLAFNLGFPNAHDRAKGYTGSFLMVHGDCVSVGCYAMTDAFIEEIYTLAAAALQSGQPAFSVHVFPFRMTVENMRKNADSPWGAFWGDLKKGHDAFVQRGQVPQIGVRNGRYAVLDDQENSLAVASVAGKQGTGSR